MAERCGGYAEVGAWGRVVTAQQSLDFLVGRRLIAVGAELFQLQPFSGVPAVFFRGVTGYTWGPLGGVGPAFSALEGDHDPDALVFSHEGRCAAYAKRNYKQTPYLPAIPPNR